MTQSGLFGTTWNIKMAVMKTRMLQRSRSAHRHIIGHILAQRNEADTAASNPLWKTLRKGASKRSNGFHTLWNVNMMVKAEPDLLPWLPLVELSER